jgi:hypothetical protein
MVALPALLRGLAFGVEDRALLGALPHTLVAEWLAAADVCLPPRALGRPEVEGFDRFAEAPEPPVERGRALGGAPEVADGDTGIVGRSQHLGAADPSGFCG